MLSRVLLRKGPGFGGPRAGLGPWRDIDAKQSVGVEVEDHVGCSIADDCVGVCIHIVEELFHSFHCSFGGICLLGSDLFVSSTETY